MSNPHPVWFWIVGMIALIALLGIILPVVTTSARKGPRSGAISNAEPPQPLLVTPLIAGTDRFDPKPFDGKAVIFWTDNSATAITINHKGHAVDASDRNLLDPANPIWHGRPPVIAWPE